MCRNRERVQAWGRKSGRGPHARTAVYEIYAIKYAHLFRHSPENFIGGDEHDVPMPLDYFVWAIKGKDRSFILDTGFSSEMGVPGANGSTSARRRSA